MARKKAKAKAAPEVVYVGECKACGIDVEWNLELHDAEGLELFPPVTRDICPMCKRPVVFKRRKADA